MSAGKGDTPRPVKGDAYRKNFDRIFRRKPKAKGPAPAPTYNMVDGKWAKAKEGDRLLLAYTVDPDGTEHFYETRLEGGKEVRREINKEWLTADPLRLAIDTDEEFNKREGEHKELVEEFRKKGAKV